MLLLAAHTCTPVLLASNTPQEALEAHAAAYKIRDAVHNGSPHAETAMSMQQMGLTYQVRS